MNHYKDMIEAIKKHYSVALGSEYFKNRSMTILVREQLILSRDYAEEIFEYGFHSHVEDEAFALLRNNHEFKTFHKGNVEAVKGMVESFIE